MKPLYTVYLALLPPVKVRPVRHIFDSYLKRLQGVGEINTSVFTNEVLALTDSWDACLSPKSFSFSSRTPLEPADAIIEALLIAKQLEGFDGSVRLKFDPNYAGISVGNIPSLEALSAGQILQSRLYEGGSFGYHKGILYLGTEEAIRRAGVTVTNKGDTEAKQRKSLDELLERLQQN